MVVIPRVEVESTCSSFADQARMVGVALPVMGRPLGGALATKKIFLGEAARDGNSEKGIPFFIASI